MSKVSIIVASGIFALGFVAATLVGCGSSSNGVSAGDFVAACNQSCDKVTSCEPDAGAIGATANAMCKMNCTTQSTTMPTTTCSNASAILSAFRNCLGMADCAAYTSCLLTTIPPCQGGSGTGGTTGGSGGTSGGSGGTSGGTGGAGAASCASCDKAGTCCVALATSFGQSTAPCSMYSTAMCNAQAAGAQATFAMGCTTLIATGASANIAACK